MGPHLNPMVLLEGFRCEQLEFCTLHVANPKSYTLPQLNPEDPKAEILGARGRQAWSLGSREALRVQVALISGV